MRERARGEGRGNGLPGSGLGPVPGSRFAAQTQPRRPAQNADPQHPSRFQIRRGRAGTSRGQNHAKKRQLAQPEGRSDLRKGSPTSCTGESSTVFPIVHQPRSAGPVHASNVARRQCQSFAAFRRIREDVCLCPRFGRVRFASAPCILPTVWMLGSLVAGLGDPKRVVGGSPLGPPFFPPVLNVPPVPRCIGNAGPS